MYLVSVYFNVSNNLREKKCQNMGEIMFNHHNSYIYAKHINPDLLLLKYIQL